MAKIKGSELFSKGWRKLKGRKLEGAKIKGRRNLKGLMYPKRSTQDIRDDIGDHQHIKIFLTLSGDEDEKKKKGE